MATPVFFNNKKIVEPGAYSAIKSLTKVIPVQSNSGNTLIIDSGLGAGYGGGSGIDGEFQKDMKSVYEFTDPSDFKQFVRGGVLYDLADYLFIPSNERTGVPKLIYIRAATTTSAVITMQLKGATGTGATFTITRSSGVITSVTVVTGGTGYKNTDVVSLINAGGGTGASLALVTSGGVVTSVTVTSGGTGYGASTAISITPTAGVNGGTFKAKVLNEGACGNGVKDSSYTDTELVKGYGAKMKAGIYDTSKFIFEFFEGTFAGLDSSSEPYNDIIEPSSKPTLIARSPELSNFSELVNWAQTDTSFKKRFVYDPTSAVAGDGSITSFDLVEFSADYTLATGGVTTYSGANFDKVLDVLDDFDISFILPLRHASEAQHVENVKLLAYNNETKYKKFIVIGGGNDSSAFTQALGSIPTAEFFDSQYVTIVHSGLQVNSKFVPGSLANRSSLYSAAIYVGLEAGLPVQVPTTRKRVRITNLQHELKPKERELCLSKGVLHFKKQGSSWVVNQGVNSLQRNTQLVNPDGTSFENQVIRIAEQINKEIPQNIENSDFFIGNNKANVSLAEVEKFVESYLASRTVKNGEDNLLISYREIKASRDQDNIFCNYKIDINGPINKIFTTGFII